MRTLIIGKTNAVCVAYDNLSQPSPCHQREVCIGSAKNVQIGRLLVIARDPDLNLVASCYQHAAWVLCYRSR